MGVTDRIFPNKAVSPRLCINCRRLNAVTLKNAYPIPQMDDCSNSFGEGRRYQQ